jgi:hypothetical protein
MLNVNIEGDFRHLYFIILLHSILKRLLFHIIDCMLLSLLVGFICSESAYLNHEAGQLEVMELVQFKRYVSILGDLNEDLLNEGAIRVLKQVHQVFFQYLQQ